MNTGTKELKSILEELDELKLPHMAAELETLYKQPSFVNTGRLELISTIIHAEYIVAIANRYTSRLTKAKLKGSDSCLDQCVDSRERQYQPQDIVRTLSSLDFIRDGMNLCVFGASDSGKTYLARALGAEACREYRVAYYHCEELVSELAATRKIDFKQYQKKVKAIVKLDWMTFYCTQSRRMMKSKLCMMSWRNGMSCQGAVLSAHSVSQRHGHPCLWKMRFHQTRCSSG